MDELLVGHSDHIWTKLGVRLHVFLTLEHELHTICGFEDSQCNVTVKEQLAIFLYICVTGLLV